MLQTWFGIGIAVAQAASLLAAIACMLSGRKAADRMSPFREPERNAVSWWMNAAALFLAVLPQVLQ